MTFYPSQMRPRNPIASWVLKAPFVWLTLAYALAVLYSSLILGPDGVNYVAISPIDAVRKFLTISYVDNGSDQRPDWIANMMMIIPLAFFMNGMLTVRRRPLSERGASALTFLSCAVFILAVKFAQLFFPPRTVTINYVVAQLIGDVLGIYLFRFARRELYPTLVNLYRDGEGLAIILGAYTVGVTAYFLMPFDLALTPDDLATRLSDVPLAVAPGAGHDIIYRVSLLLADTISTVPVGMLLAVTGRDLSFRSLVLRGFALIVPVTILTLFVLSATPFALSLVTRTAGVCAGIWFMWALKGKDLWKRHYRYGRYVPILFPVYIVLIFLASGIFTGGWLTADQAAATLEPRELLPLWSFYISTKADAARNFVTTFFLFAPIGGMIWLRRGFWSRGARMSSVLAFSLSLLIEICRMMKPGLVPDFTAPFVAAFGAAGTFLFMPTLWKMFEHEAKISALHDTRSAAVRHAAQLFNISELRPLPRHRSGPSFEPRAPRYGNHIR